MNQRKHGMLEDVGAEIGYTATNLLVAWFGGIGQLYVPTEASEDHPICKVIGLPAFKRLVKMFEGVEVTERFVWLNQSEQRDIARRDRAIAALFHLGLGAKQISVIIGMSERTVQLSRQKVEQMGVLPMILTRSGLRGLEVFGRDDDEMQGAKIAGKTQWQNQGQKLQEKPGGKTGGANEGAKMSAKADASSSTAARGQGSARSVTTRPKKRRSKRAW